MNNLQTIKYALRLTCLVIIFSSCAHTKAVNKLKERGFSLDKDTIYVSQNEYVIVANKNIRFWKSKTVDSNILNLKLDIKGFENSDTISLSNFQMPFQFTIDDTSIHEISAGRMDLHFKEIIALIILASRKFNTDISNFQKIAKNSNRYTPIAIMIFGIKIKKNNIIYAIPPRYYYLTNNNL